jgi:hypothetical protein
MKGSKMPSKKKTPAAATKKPAAKPAGKPQAKPAAKSPAKGKAKAAPAAKASPAGGKAKAKAPATAGKAKAGKAATAKPEGEARVTVRGIIAEMIAEQKHTDQEMIAAAAKALPAHTVNINIVGACRSEMNHGRRVPEGAAPGTRYEQIVKVDGVNMPKSKRPKKEARPRKPARGKVSPAHDPLSKLGIAPAKRTPARKATATA